MSLSSNIQDLAVSVSTKVKTLFTLINGNDSSGVSRLNTTATTLVDAVNEVKTTADAAAGGGVAIDDASVRTDATWSSSKIDTELDGKADSSHGHAAGDISGLAPVATSGVYSDLTGLPTIPTAYDDLTGTVPASALPDLAISEYLGEAADETALLALSGQRGDWATRTDLGTDWILIADDASVIESWREMNYPSSPVSSVNGRTGAVTGLAEQADLAALTNNVGDTTRDFEQIFLDGLE